jgi:hypothetical protein
MNMLEKETLENRADDLYWMFVDLIEFSIAEGSLGKNELDTAGYARDVREKKVGGQVHDLNDEDRELLAKEIEARGINIDDF